MTVKVVKLSIPNKNKTIINSDMTDYLELNNEYVVLGLSVEKNISYVEIFDGIHLIAVPLNLFVIIDPKVSKFWKIRTCNDGSMTLWPHEFYIDFFHDNLSDEKPEIVRIFNQLMEKIIIESNSPAGALE